jgi:dipeptidyl aminopeptidase/acylaminoacyl peptidase
MEKSRIIEVLKSTPYTHIVIGDDDRTITFLREQDSGARLFHAFDSETGTNFEEGKTVVDEDFAKRNYFPGFHSSELGRTFFVSDEDNTENLNFYTIDHKTNEFKALTENLYTGTNGFSKDMTKMAFANRTGKDEKGYLSELKIKDLQSGEEKLIWKDQDSDYRLSWGKIIFSPDHKKMVVALDYLNKRMRFNYMLIDVETGENQLILPESLESSSLFIIDKEFDGEGIHYVSNRTGFDNLFYYNMETNEEKLILDTGVESVDYSLNKDGTLFAIGLCNREEGATELLVIDLEGNEKIRQRFEGNVYIRKFNEQLWLLQSAVDLPPEVISFDLKDNTLVESKRFGAFLGERSNLARHSTKFVKYKSFDGKEVPSLLTLPKGDVKGAVITSFYGGSNDFLARSTLMAELGIAHLSPAVRGSWDHGKEWRDLIQGDLGGDEIIDIFWGAKFLEKELGLRPNQIGVRGGSHGGYATLRALTMPEDYKGLDLKYDWGFGSCWAGFACLEDFYKTSNIPDWLVYMLGEYEENVQLYKDRSPINFFENLKTPLFVHHGTNDNRVNYSSMRPFIEKLQASDVPHDIVLTQAAGHGAANIETMAGTLLRELEFVQKALNI